MAFANNFVAVLVSNNQILRENRVQERDEIYIPFGNEYSFRFKNLNSKRALVNIWIDGKSVSAGGLVIDPNKEIDFLGEINNNLAHNSFKFIEKTQEISDYRGDRIDDGIIRIEVQFEKVQKPLKGKPYTPYDNDQWTRPPFHPKWPDFDRPHITFNTNPVLRGSSFSCQSASSESSFQNDCVDGITVPGSVVDQRFTSVTIGPLENDKTVFTFQLVGKKKDNTSVVIPKTIQQKTKCPTCGKISKSNSNFCKNCGTCLI
jgi:hypothetical protein